MFKTTLILITQADATDLIRKKGKRQRDEVRGEGGEEREEEGKGREGRRKVDKEDLSQKERRGRRMDRRKQSAEEGEKVGAQLVFCCLKASV